MEYIIKRITAQVFNVAETEVNIAYRLMGGMSNLMYVVEVKGEKYTFRIPGKNAEVFVDREEECQNINRIKPLELNNKTIYFDVTTGYKIAEFVEGTPLGEITEPQALLPEVSKLLHRLHESGLKAVLDYSPYERLEKYERLVSEFNQEADERYLSLKGEFLSYRSFLDQFPRVICHNDSQISNVVVAPNQMYLLDWEFAGQNDPLYDVACVGNQDFTLAESLLPLYLGGEPKNSDWKRLYLWRAFQCLQWHNVARYKDLIGLSEDLKVDFKFISQAYLDKATSFLAQAKPFQCHE